MPIDLDILFYASDGTPRGVDPDRIAAGVTWEYLELGGMGRATIPLATAYDATLGIEGKDRVVIVPVGSDVPLYIGSVEVPEGTLATTETRSLTCYGPMEDMNRLRERARLGQEGGIDAAVLADQLADLYAAKRPGVSFSRDFLTTGVLVEELLLEDATQREAWDRLAGVAPGVLVWGWDVDPATGGPRLYLRARSESVGWQYTVGENVRLLSGSTEYSTLLNRASPLRGGTAKHPNLLAPGCENNTAFDIYGRDELEIVEANVGDAPGFLGAFTQVDFPGAPDGGWVLSGGAVYALASAANGPVRSAPVMVELPAVGAMVAKTLSAAYHYLGSYAVTNASQSTLRIPLQVGRTYKVGVHARRKTPGATSTALVTFRWLNGTGVPIGAPVTVAVAPRSDQEWERFEALTACPAGAVGLSWQCACDAFAGGSLMIDDARAVLPFAGLTGWGLLLRSNLGNTSSLLGMDAAYPGGLFGATCLRLHLVTHDNDNADSTLDCGRVAVTPGTRVRASVWIAATPGTNTIPKLRLKLLSFNGSGGALPDAIAVREASVTTVSGPAGAVRVDVELVLDQNATVAQININFRGAGDVLLLGAAITSAASDAEQFTRADQFERFVRATEVCPPGSDAALSESRYGIQEDVVSAPGITFWDDRARAYMAAVFGRYADPNRRDRVEIEDVSAEALAADLPGPGAGLRLRVSGLAGEQGDLWPASASFMWDASGRLSASIPLGDDEPTLARVLAGQANQIAQRVSVGGGGGVSATGGSVPGGAALPTPPTSGGPYALRYDPATGALTWVAEGFTLRTTNDDGTAFEVRVADLAMPPGWAYTVGPDGRVALLAPIINNGGTF